jgi:DNA-binding beta-propeller fold protein YncE
LVDLASETIIKTINGGIQPSGLDITRDGAFAYFSNYNTLYSSVGITGSILTFNDLTAGAGTVNIIDLETMAIVGPTVAVDQSPANIAIYGDFAYVTNYTSNTVAVLEL